MLLRVGPFHSLVYDGTLYRGGDEFEVPHENAAQWLRTGLVVPVDGQWPEGVYADAERPTESRKTSVKRPAAACPCEPGDRPKDLRRKSMQRCPVDECQCFTWRGKCKAHARTRSADAKEYGTGHRNVDADLMRQWKRVRREYLLAHPYCECEECSPIADPLRPTATEVDHIDGLGLLGPRRFDSGNLQSLTKAHHSRKTARESFGH
jgi:hypothetical protein